MAGTFTNTNNALDVGPKRIEVERELLQRVESLLQKEFPFLHLDGDASKITKVGNTTLALELHIMKSSDSASDDTSGASATYKEKTRVNEKLECEDAYLYLDQVAPASRDEVNDLEAARPKVAEFWKHGERYSAEQFSREDYIGYAEVDSTGAAAVLIMAARDVSEAANADKLEHLKRLVDRAAEKCRSGKQ